MHNTGQWSTRLPWVRFAGKNCPHTLGSGNMFFYVPKLNSDISNCGTSKTPLWRRSPTGSTICNACGLYLKARNTSRPINLKRTPLPSASTPASEFDMTDQHRSLSPSESDGVSPKTGAAHIGYHLPTGSCPGGGRCNGTGGADGCNGCPAYNNRLSKKAQPVIAQAASGTTTMDNLNNDVDLAGQRLAEDESSSSTAAQNSPMVVPQAMTGELSCKNCLTTITPLWRRDESGHTICNACGMSFLKEI